MKKIIHSVWIAAMITMLIGCYTVVTDPFNATLYSFEETEFVSTMRDMSASIGRIEDASISDSGVEETRVLILDELNYLRSLTLMIKNEQHKEKKTDNSNKNSYYHKYLTRLEDDIDKAIRQINKKSPSFYVAGKIVGACKGCHENVRGLSF